MPVQRTRGGSASSAPSSASEFAPEFPPRHSLSGPLGGMDDSTRAAYINNLMNSIDLQRSLRPRVGAREGAPACDECRRRKVKCDRKAPCTRCVASKRDCTSKDTLMRRGPLTREQRAVFAFSGITYESHRERMKKRRLLQGHEESQASVPVPASSSSAASAPSSHVTDPSFVAPSIQPTGVPTDQGPTQHVAPAVHLPRSNKNEPYHPGRYDDPLTSGSQYVVPNFGGPYHRMDERTPRWSSSHVPQSTGWHPQYAVHATVPPTHY